MNQNNDISPITVAEVSALRLFRLCCAPKKFAGERLIEKVGTRNRLVALGYLKRKSGEQLELTEKSKEI